MVSIQELARGFQQRWRAIMTPEVDTASKPRYDGPEHRKHYRRAEDSLNGSDPRKPSRKPPLWVVLVTSILTGSGSAITIPFIAPQLYRHDPATGTELGVVEKRVDDIEAAMQRFLIEGPREVRNSLNDISSEIEKMHDILIRQDERAKLHRHKHPE